MSEPTGQDHAAELAPSVPPPAATAEKLAPVEKSSNEAQTPAPDLALHWPAPVRLVLISFLTLFFELLIVRWLPTEIRILAYFSNFTLISCVLGLGLGAVVAHEPRSKASSFFYWLAGLIALAYVYHGLQIALPIASSREFIWNGLSRAIRGTPVQYLALALFLCVNTMTFVPLGQLLGREFDRLPALRAYTFNVLGALVGVAVFAAFSRLGVPPLWWFACGIALLLPLLKPGIGAYGGAALCLGLVLLGAWDPDTYWSPYYKITVQRGEGELVIAVNDDVHQGTVSARYHPNSPNLKVYDLPYQLGTPAGDVLVVGAGSGNDVAAALRANAKSVYAVEIDPVILELGEQHGDRPYADRRVVKVNRDARAFVKHTDKKFDHIVMGYLDSHALFSAMSSVRLDNFVYTLEFMNDLKRHLKPDGVISLTFTVHEKWIAARFYAMLNKAFGYPPLAYMTPRLGNATIYLAGDPIRQLKPRYLDYSPTQSLGATWQLPESGEGFLRPEVFALKNVEIPTDDWPYLYLQSREIPPSYMTSLLVMLAIALLFVRKRAGGLQQIDYHFFLLGAGFLLVETKAMTELAMFLGSTWAVNAFVIAMILALILLANWVAAKPWCPSTRNVYAALGFTIVASYVVPIRNLLEWQSELRNVVALLALCMPLFFAGIIFASQMKLERRPSVALGSNLMGALVGGALEYCSMAYGFHALYLLAFALYGLSFLVLLRNARATAPA